MNAGGELLEFQRIPHEVVKAAREWALANAWARERQPKCLDEDRGLSGRQRPRPSSQGRQVPSVIGRTRNTPRRIRRRTTSRWLPSRLRCHSRHLLRRPEPDYMAELEQLAQLKAQGIIARKSSRRRRSSSSASSLSPAMTRNGRRPRRPFCVHPVRSRQAGLQAASKAVPDALARTSAPDASSTCAAAGEGVSPLVSPFTEAM